MTEEQRKKLAYEAMEARLAQIPNSSVPVNDLPKAVELPPVAEVPKPRVPSVTVEAPVVQPVIEQPVQYYARTQLDLPSLKSVDPVETEALDVPFRPVDEPYLKPSKPVNYRAVLSWVAFLVFIVVVAVELYLFVFN
ncbi:hypothetical protein [Dyadobacter sp. 32]|uniref:hypothetical protein n=1 Tax=Dyadobacter sp. 32 TaxID=538966 RepID=UPI0011EEBEF0